MDRGGQPRSLTKYCMRYTKTARRYLRSRSAHSPAKVSTSASKLSLSSLLSTVALLLSLLTFYTTYLRVDHSLRLASLPSELSSHVGLNMDVANCDLPIDLVFINDGNRTETIIEATPVAMGGPRGGTYEVQQKISPFALKPGDAIPLHQVFHLTDANFHDDAAWKNDGTFNIGMLTVKVAISAVASDGYMSKTEVPLGQLRYFEGHRFEYVPAPSQTTTRLIRLLK